MDSENTITLFDEDGKEVQFEHLDTISKNGKIYVVLLEVLESGEENDEVVIFSVSEDENGEDALSVIEDEEELMDVFEEFQNRLDASDE